MHKGSIWYVSTLLGMLALLMIGHLAMLWLGTLECDEQARILFDYQRLQIEQGNAPEPIRAGNSECNEVEENFSSVAAQYIALILALLSGAGYATTQARKED